MFSTTHARVLHASRRFARGMVSAKPGARIFGVAILLRAKNAHS
jgi:hypothetical protein